MIQLPVADLIGLRFSLLQLRLVGYGVLGSWLVELVNLLTSPGLMEIGTRLHYISQFLDLTPLLLAGIGLVAYQGGLRRSTLERRLLPLAFTLLPLVSAVHFFLAPVSVANAVTLIHKQRQIGNDQLERIDRQLDRAARVLQEGDSIESLLERLQQIPGLRVRVPADASVTEARRQVRTSLERERSSLQQRIRSNLATSAEAFWRRSLVNAALALGVGVLVWGLHSLALREMGQAIPYLDWFVTASEAGRCEPSAELELLGSFMRSCVALSPGALLQLLLRRRRRGDQEEEDSQEQLDALARSAADPLSAPPEWPQPQRPAAVLRSGSPLSLPLMPPMAPPGDDDWQPGEAGEAGVASGEGGDSGDNGDGGDGADPGDGLPPLSPAEWRRQQHNFERASAHWAAMGEAIDQQHYGSEAAAGPADPGDPDGQGSFGFGSGLSRRELRRRARDLERSRQALRDYAEFLRYSGSDDGLLPDEPPAEGEAIGEEWPLPPPEELPHEELPPPPRGLRGLWWRLFG